MIHENGFVGVKNSFVKDRLKEGRYRICEVSTDDLAYDCKRHAELLELYEKNRDLRESLYYRINRSYFKRDDGYIMRKLDGFLSLYNRIKNDAGNELIRVTPNKARLDGSHRAAILKFLKIKSVKVKEICAPKTLLWIVGREVIKKKLIYEKYKGKTVYINGKPAGRVLFSTFVRKDIFSLIGNYYHILDTGDTVRMEECCLEK